MSSRAADPAETAASERVVALDGVAVIVHKNNPITRLTLQQVADIFSGTLVNWAQLGGAPMRIQVYARDEKSGTFDTFKQMVLRGRPMQWRGAGAYEGSAALADAVAGDERGIGFIALPYVKNTRALALQDGEATPLYPTVFTVSTEDYALSRRLRLYAPAQSRNPMVQKFLDLALSDEGQRLVGDAGFIPLTVRAQAFQPPREAPEKYVRATQGGQRLSVNFRFKKGSSELDGKALQDVDSVVKFLSASELYRTRRMMLFGFADRSGKEAVNRLLSRQRADAVAAELKEHGVVLEKVEGFGSALPLSSSSSDEARERNRRVEVWVR
jgi:phosphate transport system substrate-binding protein